MAVSNLKAQFEAQSQKSSDREHQRPLPNSPAKRKQGSNETSAKIAPTKLKNQISKTIKTSGGALPVSSAKIVKKEKPKISKDVRPKSHHSTESSHTGFSALAEVLTLSHSPSSERRLSQHLNSSQAVNSSPTQGSPSPPRKSSRPSQCSSLAGRTSPEISPESVAAGRTSMNGVGKKPLPKLPVKSRDERSYSSEEDSNTAIGTDCVVLPESKANSFPSIHLQKSEGDNPQPHLSKGPKPKPPLRPKPRLVVKPYPPQKPQISSTYKPRIPVVIPSSTSKRSPESSILSPPSLVVSRVTTLPNSPPHSSSQPMSISVVEREQECKHMTNEGKPRSSSLPVGKDEPDGGVAQTAKEMLLLSPAKKEDYQSEIGPIERVGERHAVQSQAISSAADAGETGGCKRRTTDSGYQEEEFEELISREEKKEPTKEVEVWDSEKLEKARRKRKNIALELLDTEKTYVARLTLISQDFRDVVQQFTMKGSKPAISEQVVNLIFLNISEIHNLNSQLLKDLEERMEKWSSCQQIGDVMASFAPFLKLYSRYTSGFEDAMKILTEWMGKEKKLGMAVKEFEKRLGTGLGVTHYMLEPVQRIPRYKMLLTDYIKQLPPDSPEAPAATKALAIIAEAADKSNERIKEMENSNEILSIQQSLSDYHGTLLLAHRKFIKKGILQKMSKKAQTSRMFFLFTDVLLHTEITGPTSYRFKNELSLSEMKVEVPKVSLLKFSFQILGTNRSFILCASSEEERSDWLYALLSAINDDKEKRQSLRREHLLTLDRSGFGTHAPIMVPDQSVSMCQICFKEFTVTFRRHHCRACGRVVCGGCSSHKAHLDYLGKLDRVCTDCYSQSCGEETDSPQSPMKKKSYAGPSVLLLDPSKTEVVMEGYVLEQEGKKWNRVWFMVDKDLALYKFKAHEDVKATETVPLPGYKITSEKATNAIHLIHHSSKKKLNLSFRTESVDEFESWVYVLDKATRLEIPEPMAKHPNSPPQMLCSPIPREDRTRSKSLSDMLDGFKESLDDNSV